MNYYEKMRKRKYPPIQLSFFFLLFCVLCSVLDALAIASRPVKAQNGLVVSSQLLASEAGVATLKEGGNAVDAAVATGFALAVVHPAAGNIGGGGFMVIRFPDGKATTIDFREKAPAKAHRDMYLNSDGSVNSELSTIGHLSAGVPGTVAGLVYVLEKYGSLPLKKIMAPAIALAQKGFLVSEDQAKGFANFKHPFQKFPATAKTFLHSDGSSYKEGERLIQKDLAATLKLIATKGEEAFYRGKIADLLVADMERNGGLITHQDLLDYRVVEREPVRGTYKDYEILSMPPPSSGGVALLEMLNVLEPVDLAGLGHNSSRYVHYLVETMRRVFADRAQFFGDPDFVSVPTVRLFAKDYAARLRASIDLYHATRSKEIAGHDSLLFQKEGKQTTHYSVADGSGMAVAVTYTLNGSYGSMAVVEGAGFLLNNEMDDFSAKPGAPNMYGLIQSEANAIAPGKRMLSSMAPTIVTRNGRLFMVIGSPGGPTIINTVLQVFLNVAEFDMNIQEAIDAPRFHHQWLPDVISYERNGLVQDVVENLQAKGHSLQEWRMIGEAEGILFDAAQKCYYGAADPRGEGAAVGY
jgi:gamma-glutamyltranspeptidase/glutathione hydrolase